MKSLICIVLFELITGSLLFAQKVAFVNTTAANLRESPGGNLIMQLPYGTELQLIDINSNWCKVDSNTKGVKGYVHNSVISYGRLFQDEDCKKKISSAKLTYRGFEDMHITTEDDAMEIEYDDDLYRQLNESLERMLYWESDKVSAIHYIYNLDVFVERTKYGKYNNTPCAIINRSKAYNVTCEVYNNEMPTKFNKREIAKPRIKKSFFDCKPENYLIDNAVEDNGAFRLNFSKVKFIHLLRIYFRNGNSFKLQKKNGKYVYTSTDRIRFFTTDYKGNNVIENSGIIDYYPGQYSKLCITDLKVSYKREMGYLFFTNENLLNKHLKNKIKITPTVKIVDNWFELDVFAIDFNNDGIVDMLQSFEECPGEAGDSGDEVYYFNVNGKWMSMLARRYWCNP